MAPVTIDQLSRLTTPNRMGAFALMLDEEPAEQIRLQRDRRLATGKRPPLTDGIRPE